jgi:hypothetical protein
MKYKKKYIYDHGFGEQVYLCIHCNSHRLIMKPQPGFTPPKYVCDDCKNVSHSPMNIKVNSNLKTEEEAQKMVNVSDCNKDLVFEFMLDIDNHIN